jgi:dCTP deaminase
MSEPTLDSLEPTEPSSLPTGILPGQTLREFLRDKTIQSLEPLADDQIQPASLDLRLGRKAYRVRASFLPGRNATVQEKLTTFSMREIDLTDGAVLERGCVYLVPLQEHLALRRGISGLANPKSSTGRLDVFTRLITDRSDEFDRVRNAYKGPLYLEIAPRTFSILARAGARLAQLRLRRGNPLSTDTGLRRLQEEVTLVHAEDAGRRIDNGIPLTVDLLGEGAGAVIGWRAKPYTDLVDIDRIGQYEPHDFWDPIHANLRGDLVLDPNGFYILASREAVTVPPDQAAEMAPFNPVHGEFRVHYAGFFDPGFGWAEAGGQGSRAVLEVRSFEVPFVIEHGQVVARLMYERMAERPERLYGQGIGSNYQRQGLKLGKQFKATR